MLFYKSFETKRRVSVYTRTVRLHAAWTSSAAVQLQCSLTAGKRLQNGTHFELWPETGGPLPGVVVVRGTGTAAGMALRVQPQRTAFVFFHCKSSTRWNGSEKPPETFVEKIKKKKNWTLHFLLTSCAGMTCSILRIFKCNPGETNDKFINS